MLTTYLSDFKHSSEHHIISYLRNKLYLWYWNDKVEMERQYDPCQQNHEHHVCSILKVSQLNLNAKHTCVHNTQKPQTKFWTDSAKNSWQYTWRGIITRPIWFYYCIYRATTLQSWSHSLTFPGISRTEAVNHKRYTDRPTCTLSEYHCTICSPSCAYSSCIVFSYIPPVFGPTRNSTSICNPQNPTLEWNMKWIGWPIAQIWPLKIFKDSRCLQSWISSNQK